MELWAGTALLYASPSAFFTNLKAIPCLEWLFYALKNPDWQSQPGYSGNRAADQKPTTASNIKPLNRPPERRSVRGNPS